MYCSQLAVVDHHTEAGQPTRLADPESDVCRFYIIPKKVQEAFLTGELTKAPQKVQPRPVQDDFVTGDDDASVVLDAIAHTEIVDPYADEEFFDDLLVRTHPFRQSGPWRIVLPVNPARTLADFFVFVREPLRVPEYRSSTLHKVRARPGLIASSDSGGEQCRWLQVAHTCAS